MQPTDLSRSEAFRALHHADDPLLLPNAWDYASAILLASAGFQAIGTTSLGVAAAHGLPDGAGQAREETVALARRLADLPCLVTIDIEAGFSADPESVADLVEELATLGAAGINIEDGRPDHTLAEVARQCDLISAVRSRVPDLFINARTDTHWLDTGTTPDMGDTLARAEAYVAAGADGIFIPGISAARDIAIAVGAIAVPLNVLFLPHRHSLAQLAELGVRRISTGSLLFRAALQTTVETATAIRDGGAIRTDVPTYGEIQRLVATGRRVKPR